MIEGRLAAILAIVAALTLVGAALVRRRPAGSRLVRLALLWIGLIALAWLVANIGLRSGRYFT